MSLPFHFSWAKQISPDEFVEKIAGHAREMKRELGGTAATIPTRFIVAQAAEESGWGRSRCAREQNNPYGLSGPKGCLPFESTRAATRYYLSLLVTRERFASFRDAVMRGIPVHNLGYTLTGYSESAGYGQRLHAIMQSHRLRGIE